MSAHAVTLRLEENGIAVEGKTGRTAHVAAVGQVDDGTVALCADKTYIGIRVVPVADEFEGEPFSVRRPGIVEPAARDANVVNLIRFHRKFTKSQRFYLWLFFCLKLNMNT